MSITLPLVIECFTTSKHDCFCSFFALNQDINKTPTIIDGASGHDMRAQVGYQGPDIDTTNLFQGVIVQELQKVSPEMVNEITFEGKYVGFGEQTDNSELKNEPKTFLEVDPNHFLYALINSTKEQ